MSYPPQGEIWKSLTECLFFLFFPHKYNNIKFEPRTGTVKAKESQKCKYLGRGFNRLRYIHDTLIQKIIGTDKEASSNQSSRLHLIRYSCNIASMCLFYKWFHGNYYLSSSVHWPRIFKLRTGKWIWLFYWWNSYIWRKFYSNSLFTRNSRLWIHLPTFSLSITTFKNVNAT